MFESLQADQRQRWQRGDRLRVQSYVERYPNLATDIPNLMKLIGSEMALREAAGEAPNLDEYLSLFPQCAEELTKRNTGLHDVSLETVTFGTQPTDPSNRTVGRTARTRRNWVGEEWESFIALNSFRRIASWL